MSKAAREISEGLGRTTAPPDVDIYNPAFDVTPGALVTAIITENGVVRAPYVEGLRAAVAGNCPAAMPVAAPEAAGDLTRGIRDGRGTLGKLANDPTAANALAASLMNVQRMTDQINAGQGSLGKLVNDDAFANSLNKATASIQEITAKLNRGEGTAGKLMNDQALYNKLDAVTGRFDELLTKLNAGEGTAGQLLKDKQLYENMNGTVAELRTLLTAIQKDPKKYLNVRISVF